MTEIREVIHETLAAHIAPDAQVIEIHPRDGGEQGFSGATIRYYDVHYTRAGSTAQVTLVTKDAPLSERCTLWRGSVDTAVQYHSVTRLT